MSKQEVENGRYAIEERFDVITRSRSESDRYADLCSAVCRCIDEGIPVPAEWLEEMKSLIESILAGR